jgi:tetratricopeptide (TPR) repeat protein
MKRPHAQEYHSSHEEIASFIEGSTGEIDTMRIRAHLQSCDRCLEAYHYAVRYRGMHDDLPADDAPSREAVRAAKAIAQRDYLRDNLDRRGKRRWIATLTPAGRVAFSAAAVAVFAAAVLWLRPIAMGEDFDPYSQELTPVTAAMVTASERGQLVLPGVEGSLGSAPATVRSGPAQITRRLDNALAKLAIAYNDGDLESDEAQWLIGGYLATGQLENARVYLEDARGRYPDDRDLVVLEGLLAFGRDDLDGAAGHFESVLREEPGNAVAAFNLAVVKMESGSTTEARELLERVQNLVPDDSPLAARAGTALAGL